MAAGSGFETGSGGAMQFNTFAAGPRRYGAGRSTTATSGPVEKTGYVEREVRRRARQKAIQGMITQKPTPAIPDAIRTGMGQWQ
jgi:hypothetical protein